MSVKEWEIDEKGLKYDRKWMIVSANNGHFLTQRAKPRMVLIRASVSKEGELKLNAPGKQEIVVGKSEQALGKEIIVTIWKHTLKAIDMGDKVANWLSDFLGTNVRLVMTSKDHKRAYPDKYVSHLKEGELLNIGFADAFPFLLTSTTSLSKVQSWVDENVEIEMIRFRPNIVVSGVKHPFEEDSWRLLKIGDQQFENVKLCTRCQIPTIYPKGEKAGERYLKLRKLLLKHRTGLPAPWAKENGQLFGINLIHFKPGGTIKVGDKVEILKTQPFPKMF